VLLYDVTYTKLSLLVSFYLIFVAVLASIFKARTTVILCLLIPLGAGLLSSLYNSTLTNAVFGTFSFRLLAFPGIALDHYYVYFSDHPLTYFCQISLIEGFHSVSLPGSARHRACKLVCDRQHECFLVCHRGGGLSWAAVCAN
jgi:hypothetical protein